MSMKVANAKVAFIAFNNMLCMIFATPNLKNYSNVSFQKCSFLVFEITFSSFNVSHGMTRRKYVKESKKLDIFPFWVRGDITLEVVPK
jgi:hypothetical protein